MTKCGLHRIAHVNLLACVPVHARVIAHVPGNSMLIKSGQQPEPVHYACTEFFQEFESFTLLLQFYPTVSQYGFSQYGSLDFVLRTLDQ